MKVSRRTRLAILALAACFLVPAYRTALATDLHPAFTVEGTGLVAVEAGTVPVGPRGMRSFPNALTVFIGGPVEKAVLYWGGIMKRNPPVPGDPALAT